MTVGHSALLNLIGDSRSASPCAGGRGGHSPTASGHSYAPKGADATTTLPREEWERQETAHRERADALTRDWRARRATGEPHPVDDFLFTYYPVRPATLRRWHPGAGIGLESAARLARGAWKWYRAAGETSVFDAEAYLGARASTVAFTRTLLSATRERPARFGCFGLHEWAMVYRLPPEELRHTATPLRLGPAETDRVVETHRISCTHFDAFRFFTPAAIPRNGLQPTRETQALLEQPACLHANMDVYKWATKLGPIVPGPLLLDGFELARDIRRLDMRASPYDVSAYGLAPVPIETEAGKRDYVEQQRAFAERADLLRQRLLEAIDTAEGIARHG